MEYALSYSIPRAVIYDPVTDVNNPKYDLNRQLMKEDKKITTISRNDLIFRCRQSLFLPRHSREGGNPETYTPGATRRHSLIGSHSGWGERAGFPPSRE
jgi:hypothetical protein